jgi:glucoamylase
VWAHAEYVKLLRSLKYGRVFDTPPQTVQRYVLHHTDSPLAQWRFNHKISRIQMKKRLRVELLYPATIRWSTDGWKTAKEASLRDTGLGIYLADLPTEDLPAGTRLQFAFAGDGQGEEYIISIAEE